MCDIFIFFNGKILYDFLGGRNCLCFVCLTSNILWMFELWSQHFESLWGRERLTCLSWWLSKHPLFMNAKHTAKNILSSVLMFAFLGFLENWLSCLTSFWVFGFGRWLWFELLKMNLRSVWSHRIWTLFGEDKKKENLTSFSINRKVLTGNWTHYHTLETFSREAYFTPYWPTRQIQLQNCFGI